MSFPALEQYLVRLYRSSRPGARIWADADGRVQGRYFNATLTSAFQPIRLLENGAIIGHEGFLRSSAHGDAQLCVWKLLQLAASDEEAVALDRLCRMLHAINFFRQPQADGHDLYLSVHARLLAAVDADHGHTFRAILEWLGLPQKRVVLQLPASLAGQPRLLGKIANNYRGNGFRVVVNAGNTREAVALAAALRPEAVKIDTRDSLDAGCLMHLLDWCATHDVRVIFKRLDSPQIRDMLRQIGAVYDLPAYVQGFLWDVPDMALATQQTPLVAPARPAAASATSPSVLSQVGG